MAQAVTRESATSRLGLVQGALAYGFWGVAAVYWKQLAGFSPVELIADRALAALLVFLAIAFAAGRGPALREPREVGVMAISATLLAINWTTFVGATITGHLLEASLGYFIIPLFSVALGTILLGERMSRLQWLAIALAAIGVALLTAKAGHVPWIALVLATTFGLYGLVRKTARVDALVGSSLEMILIAPVAAIYLALHGGGAAPHADPRTLALLVGTGAITAGPLLLFTSAARRLPLSTLGFLQYLAPTGQFLLAVLVYGEPFARDRLIAFGWIWAGLVVFSIDLARRARRP